MIHSKLHLLIISCLALTPMHSFADDIVQDNDTEQQNDEILDLGSLEVVKKRDDGHLTNKLKQTGLNVDVIKLINEKNIGKDITDILASRAGIHIRETGGLGAQADISLNGISGNNVRYFINGVPIENFGSSADIANIPINLVEEIEVYKGIIPIEFGADALGGAINIITNSDISDILDVSYDYGSFNTHRLAVNGLYTTANDLFFSVNGFYNTSDNDFDNKDVITTDELGNIIGSATAKRFNDQYQAGMIAGEFGVTDKSYADKLSAAVKLTQNKNHLQHPLHSPNLVFGDLHTKSKTWQVSADYKKQLDKWSVGAHVVKGKSVDEFIDVANRNYDWSGNYQQTVEQQAEYGEKSHFTAENDILKTNIQGSYQFNKNNTARFTHSLSKVRQEAEDKYSQLNNLNLLPNTLDKSVIGLSYNLSDDANNKNMTVFLKNYDYKTNTDGIFYKSNGDKIYPKGISKNEMGAGIYNSYKIKPNLQLNSSYEKAYRLPEAHEVLGDGEKFVRRNPLLQPESSNNFNFGVLAGYKNEQINAKGEANLFYRDVEGYIQFHPDRVVQGIYRNLDNVAISGVETSAEMTINNNYVIKGNITAQQHISKSKKTASGLTNQSLNKKIANQPQLFAGLGLGYKTETKLGPISAVANVNYVDEFPLLETSLGNSVNKRFVPAQLSTDLEFTYINEDIFETANLNVGLLLKNITDATLYDNYKIQKPGRSVQLKLRYLY